MAIHHNVQQTPSSRRLFGGVMTNSPSRARSMPVQELHASKRRRLRAPFSFGSGLQGSRIEHLEGAVTELKEFTRDIKEILIRQTEVLSKILRASEAKEM